MKSFTLVVFFITYFLNTDILTGQIKSIKTTTTSNIDGKSYISEFKKFDKNENLTQLKDYDSEGKLESTIDYIYNNKKLVLKTDFNLDFKEKETTKINYDTILKTKTTKVYRNSDLAYSLIETFDNNKNIIKIVQDIKGDIHTVKYKYLFNENNAITKIISLTNGIEETFKTFKYNKNDKEVEVLKYGPHLVYKTSTEYKNGRIFRILKTTITKGLTENIKSDVTYDEFFNPIYQKVYNEKKIIREHKMTYTFDKKGNWIIKKVKTKDLIFDMSKTFKPEYTESRKIKHW
jgi:hypothetical protein